MPTVAKKQVVLTEEQQRAVTKVHEWLETDKRTLTIGGYAGTGKTTLIAEFGKQIPHSGVFTPTGKAAYVLNRKGIAAGTLHGLLYYFKGKLRHIESDEIDLIFQVKETNDSHAYDKGLIVIVDEASMVNTEIYRDLIDNVNGRMIFVGDHGQLSPVGGDPGLMKNPDIKLETIMRQQADNPIIKFAHAIRQGCEPRDYQHNSDELFCTYQRSPGETVRYCIHEGIEQIIVGFNEVRKSVNTCYRRELKRSGLVCEGERMICLLNNWTLGIMNGTIVKVLKVRDEVEEAVICDIETDAGKTIKNVPMFKEMIGAENEKAVDVPSDACAFTYGYAITCHKAQGSEWDSIAVLDAKTKHWDNKRWRYTAATRAQTRLHYFA